MVVEVRIGGRLTLIIKVFLDHVVHFVVVAPRDTSQDDLGHVVAAHHRIDMVGDVRVVTIAAWMVVHGVGHDALGAIRVVVSQKEHSRRGHVPSVVGGTDEIPNGSLGVATALRNGEDLRGNALLCPEFLDAVGQLDEFLIVGRDDHVFAACLAIFVVFASSLAVIHHRKHITVEEHVAQDLVPFWSAVTDVAISAVAAFHVKFQLHVAIDNQFFGDGIVLERHHAYFNHLYASHRHHF